MIPQLEGYTDWREVGRGGFGVVYRVREERFGRDVAIKVIRDAGLEHSSIARFERECRALGALSGHPNIVALHGSGRTPEGDLYFVMEHLGGGSVAQRLAASGPMTVEDAVALGVALAGGLETAHRAQIVHRDVKPENVLFSDYGVPKLVDFGIARMRSAYETRSGFFSATLGHAAPETLAGAPSTPSADTYSLASVLYTALAGAPPFERRGEDTLAPLINRITTAAPPDLRARGVSSAVAGVVERGLAKDPADRYPDAAALGEALAEAGRSSGTPTFAVPLASAGAVREAASQLDSGRMATPARTDDPPHPVGGTELVQRRREAVPVEGTATTAPARGRRRVVAAAAVAVLLAGTALTAVTMLGADPSDGPPETGGGGTEGTAASDTSSLVVKDAPLTTSGLRVARQYELLDDRTRVGSQVELTNRTRRTITTLWTETIPKQLATRVRQVSFRQSPTGILEADPIVYWRVRLKPGSSRTIGWSTPVPEGREPDSKLLNTVVSWHRRSIAAKAGFVARALARLTKPGVEAVPPGSTVSQGGLPVTGAGTVITAPPGAPAPKAPVAAPGTPSSGSGSGSAPAPPPNRAPVVSSPGGRTNDELQSVGLTLAVSDPDGDPVRVSVSGLPPGVGASGSRIGGTIRYDAASVTTDRRQGVRSRSFPVSVTVTDSRGATARTSFTWTVRDTHRTMPNYIGQFGCGGCGGLPDVAAISSPSFRCVYVQGADGNRIARQGVSPGSVIRWGQGITYWYGKDDTSCDR